MHMASNALQRDLTLRYGGSLKKKKKNDYGIWNIKNSISKTEMDK